MSAIRILVTGGTFDKEYHELAGTLFFKDTHVPEMLSRGRCRIEVTVQTVMMVDSLEMTAADRALIAEQCRSCPERAIVVTHGTDTMVDTARVLAAATSRKAERRREKGPPQAKRAQAGNREPRDYAKTIVLTGAMVPFAFGSSDGLFNLGSALSFVQVLPPGVYVAMNGRYFPWDRVRKNRETGTFEDV